uniref:Uncharacterized protein n=1 Tax=Ascaris lumbricoides TaxID=6252 RepID=A0A0M3HWX8_ASCLU
MKQRECIDLEERRNAQSQINLVVGSCEKNIHEARSAIHGLELRRTERNKDCVRKNIINAESIMDPTLEGTCNKLAEKFLFASKTMKEEKMKTSPRKKKDIKKKKIQQCRSNVKIWHKQCRRLAKCCSIFPDCSLETSDVQTQISKQRWRLENAKAICSQKST